MLTRNREQNVTELIVAIIFTASLLLLGREFFSAWGGGYMFLLAGMHMHYLRTTADPKVGKLLLRLSQLAYIIMGMNFVFGVSAEYPTLFVWQTVKLILMAFAILLCNDISFIFLPQRNNQPESPEWKTRRRLSKLLLIPLGTVLLLPMVLQVALFVLGISRTIEISVSLLGSVLLFCCSLVGYFSITNMTIGEAHSSAIKTLRNVLLFSPVWVITGSLAEILRGDWGLWVTSVGSFLVVTAWAYVLARRTPLLQRAEGASTLPARWF